MEFLQIHMTLDSLVWDPYDSEIGRVELECRLKLVEQPLERNRQIKHVLSNRHTEFDTMLEGLTISETRSSRRKGRNGLDAAKLTVDQTIQIGVHDIRNHLSRLERRQIVMQSARDIGIRHF
jgi:hypothetical protein